MNIGDFELLVCRTAGVAPAGLDRGALETVVRGRAAATGCRTLCEYADHVEVSGAELAALVEAVLTAAMRMLPATQSGADTAAASEESAAPVASRLPGRQEPPRPLSRTDGRNAGSNAAVVQSHAQPAEPTPARKLLAGHLASTATPDTRALILLGLLRERDGNREDALACYRLAERRAPADARAWRALLTVLIAGTEAAHQADMDAPAQRRA